MKHIFGKEEQVNQAASGPWAGLQGMILRVHTGDLKAGLASGLSHCCACPSGSTTITNVLSRPTAIPRDDWVPIEVCRVEAPRAGLLWPGVINTGMGVLNSLVDG